MAKKVVFVADDFGMGAEVNRAVVHAHTAGALDAACLMMGQPGTGEAVTLARAHPSLAIGWHLHLNDSWPTTMNRWPWDGPSSAMQAGWRIGFSRRAREAVRREIVRQWELFRQTGLECRFVNCHHHLHAHPFVWRTLMEGLGPDFKGWIRLGDLRAFSPRRSPAFALGAAAANFFQHRRRKVSRLRSPDTLWGVDRTFRMQADEVRAAVAGLGEGFHEFLFHPRSLLCQDTLCLLELRSDFVPFSLVAA